MSSPPRNSAGGARARSQFPAIHPLLLGLCLVVAFVPACAGRRFVIPAGPPGPAPDAAGLWERATSACRPVHAARATMRLSARSGGCRIPTVRIGLAIDAGQAIALDARVGGTMVFRLAGPAEQTTLFLRDGPRVLRAPAADIVEALVGVKLDPARLLAVLSGCVTPRPDFVKGARRDAMLEVTAADAVAYLAPVEGGWQVRAGTFDALEVDYARRGPTWPRDINIRSRPSAAGPAIAITITDLEIEPNAPLPPALFGPPATDGASPVSLDELRRTCPTGGPRD